MAATPEVDSVWIGFMDIVPVIGTVKEAVELVLALYEGNPGVIREKMKAVENFVEESLQQPVKKSVPGKPAAAAADVSDFTGLRNVREVKKEKIIEHVAKGSKRGPKLTPAQQEQRKAKVQNIKSNVLKKIQNIDPNYNQELKEELKPAKRGEHVFNNGLLRFHSNVLDAFVQRNNIHNLRGYNQGTIAELGKHTLHRDTEKEIQHEMVVHFDDDDDHYVNANAGAYGDCSRELLNALVAVLRHINPGGETPAERRRVSRIIGDMNNRQIYVDQYAKAKWINDSRDRQDRQARFDTVRGQVATMYTTHRGLGWCTQVMTRVAPWFVNTQ